MDRAKNLMTTRPKQDLMSVSSFSLGLAYSIVKRVS